MSEKTQGKPLKLSKNEVNYIIKWISLLKCTRCIFYKKIVRELNLPVGSIVLARTF